ncbi:hypothetical protein N0V94_004949 [Neodidymelliopsis sp. IMI 364377]|nr:hypothetical protein N0V94_004949 [Neodidymelliopsis sp. IMI 364377]
MLTSIFVALIGLSDLVHPQLIDLDYINAQPEPSYSIIVDKPSQTITYNQTEAIAADVADVLENPIATPAMSPVADQSSLQKLKRQELVIEVPSCQTLNGTLYDHDFNDTEVVRVERFLRDSALQEQAANAPTPEGYVQVFQNLTKASQANGYMGATSQYNIDHSPETPSNPPQLCTFFNTYILEKNSVSQGQYCAMYSQFWDPNVYARNDGQWDDNGNHFTIKSSVFSTNVTAPVIPANITSLRDDLVARIYCTSYISFVAPTTVTTELTNTATIEICSTSARATDSVITTTMDTAIMNSLVMEPPMMLGARNVEEGGMIEAVVAIWPDKVDDPSITGSFPAQVPIPSNSLHIADAYLSATSEAIFQLGATETGLLVFSTKPSVPAVTPQATPILAVHKRQLALTPTFFVGRNSLQISSVCSRVVDTTAPTLTQYATADATETATVNCSDVTICQDSSLPTLIAGSFSDSPNNIDDIYYTIQLPFQICIYDTCNATVHPSSNGVITLGDFATSEYDNNNYSIPASVVTPNAALFAYWDDLYIFPNQRHYMDYSICGNLGSRTVVFSWKVGHYIRSGPVFDNKDWSFSATFFEDDKGHVLLNYGEVPDKGTSASIGMQGVLGGEGKSDLGSIVS